jgi:mxaJ protein
MSSGFPSVALAAAVLLALPNAAAASELRVCADPNNLPFSNERGEGFENKIAELLARELHADLTYTWWAQRRGFLRNTLDAGLCDLVPGMPSRMERLRTTAPYYRSSYVFVSRAADHLAIASLDDPALRDLRIGVQLVGDDGANPPPAHALARRGLARNLRGYSVYGNYAEPDPAGRIVAALARGEIDLAVVWGPFAGYFAPRQAVPLEIAPVRPQSDASLPMAFDISMGVRKDDEALGREIETALAHRRADVDAILAVYGVPRVDGADASRDAAP